MSLRESMEGGIRRGIVYPLLRRLLRNRPSEEPIDFSRVGTILIFRFDRIGDMLVTLPVLRALKQCAPHVKVGVLGSRTNADIARGCTSVDKVYVLERNWLKVLRQINTLRNEKPDVVMNFVFNKTTTPALLANLIAPNGLKVGQGPDKFGFYFNRLVKIPRFERHMTEQLAVFVEQAFGVQIPETAFESALEVPFEQKHEVDEWLGRYGLKRRSEPGIPGTPYVVFNISAYEAKRRLSEIQITKTAFVLSKNPAFRAVVVFDPLDRVATQLVETRPELSSCSVFRTGGLRPLLQLASLIEGAIAVFTPDTSIIHFASAVKTPVFGIYGGDQIKVEWAPFRVRNRTMRTEGDLPASSLKVEDIEQEISSFLESILAH